MRLVLSAILIVDLKYLLHWSKLACGTLPDVLAVLVEVLGHLPLHPGQLPPQSLQSLKELLRILNKY